MAKSNGKRVRRRIWIAILVMAIAGIGVVVARPKAKAEDEKGKIKTAKAERGDVQVRVTEVGSVEPQVKVDVKSVLSGRVVELLVREGDQVKRGQVLARVEPDVNQARDLAQVKNAVAESEIALAEAGATHERNRGLLGQGLLSDQAGLESETRYRQAKATFDAAMDKYRIVRESGVPIAMAETGISRRLNVSSPMDGVVIRRPVELGDTVMSGVSSFNAGTVLMTVADVETMIIKAGINEVDIGKVRLEQPVKVSLDAYPKVRFPGTIKRIAPAARLEEKVKVFDVEIAIDRQGNELRTGMTANIDVVGEKRSQVLAVPVEAIFKKDETEVVSSPGRKGASAFLTTDQVNDDEMERDNAKVYVPLTTAQTYFAGNDAVNAWAFQADPDDLENAQKEAEALMRRSHRGITDFKVQNIGEEILRVRKEIDVLVGNWRVVLASIAGISLLVGGIGIFSVMQISISERTYEIGLRKAMGATDPEIFGQFLIESVSLSLVGGGLGALLGYGITLLAGQAFESGLPVSPLGLGLAAGFAVVIGLGAGVYPALRASRLHPVEAIRGA